MVKVAPNFFAAENNNQVNGEPNLQPSPKYHGLSIGKYPHVQRDGWYYKTLNKDKVSMKPIKVDKILMMAGLRSMSLKTSKETGLKGRRSFIRVLYQLLILFFMVFMFFRWTILTMNEVFPLPGHRLFIPFLGDFMDGHGSKYSRFYYKTEVLFVAVITLVSHVLMVIWEKNKKRNLWLEILSFVDRKGSKFRSFGLTDGVVADVWVKANRNMKIYLPLATIMVASVSSAIVLDCQVNRQENQTMIQWIWTLLDIFWLSLLGLHFSAFLLIFDIFTHYFDVRVQKLIYDTEQIYKYRNEFKFEERNDIMWSMLKDFDTICGELKKVDIFWQYFLLMVLQVGPFAILLGLNNNLVFRTRMNSVLHYSTIWILTFVLLILWAMFVMRASRVAARMERFYLVLNRSCLIPVNDSMKVRMENAVKRFDGLHIGFNCFDMFTVGHEYIYHVSLFWGSGYILLLDAGQAQTYANAVARRRRLRGATAAINKMSSAGMMTTMATTAAMA